MRSLNNSGVSRRDVLRGAVGAFGAAGLVGASGALPVSFAAPVNSGTEPAKSCIIVYCWGGMSHHETFDPKPDAPAEIRGEFQTIATNVPGVRIGEHLPRLAQQMDKLAVIRSIRHGESAHGRGMYWNLTGHAPPPNPPGNIAPQRSHWPSFAAMVSELRTPAMEGRGNVPSAIRLPYPMVDNGTLQAGEYGGWLGVEHDPIVLKTPQGAAWGGVSRSLGSEVLELGSSVDLSRVSSRRQLLDQLEQPVGAAADFAGHRHFRALANNLLLSDNIKRAYDLANERRDVAELYGDHIGGQSLLLARRLVEAGVPVVQVCYAAGDLNGGSGDMWDTHGDNFNRLKNRLLPVLDQGLSALLSDLQQRGMLDRTLVMLTTDFGRTPQVNGSAGRDHYPGVYSVALAGGGIRGGQVYGASDAHGAHPAENACTPADLHATAFRALGVSPRAKIYDPLNRPFPVSDGKVLPLF
ncbi:MAG: DUF1501 domain-containing protein [Planctomycetales bacterium]|nr:DUF1501 domain-containing protein [Planctomycetales bacterium]